MWYVVQTTSGQEQDCLAVCRAKMDSFLYKEMFVPLYIDKMHFRKQWHDVKKVLFPGYFFVATDDIDEVAKELSQINRLTKVLRNAEKIAPIQKKEQDFLRAMMNEEYIVECSKGFIIGDRVCITEGPLRNHYGFIRKVDRHRRIAKLEINFFGRLTPVEVGLEIVARLTEEQFEKLKKDRLETYASARISPEAGASSGTKGSVETETLSGNKNLAETETLAKTEILAGETVKVKSGVFAGMRGILLSTNEKKDEWRVRIELFEHPTEVVFLREEIMAEKD